MNLRDVPLAFLPTFEAAGRLGSFAAAAAAVHLTPSAVSQQIRALEESLGVMLFERTARGAVLTQVGTEYLQAVQQALSALAASTSRVRRSDQRGLMRLSTVALAAHEFLLPRLPDFQLRFPDIELRIESSNDVVDFRTSDFDAAIRVDDGSDGLVAYPLGQLEAAVVCSHSLAQEIGCVEDLTRYRLLDPNGQAGAQLAALRGGMAFADARTWEFETCFEALRAAEHGLGVAFAVFPIATHWVTSGRLAVPLPDRIPLPGKATFVHPPPEADQPQGPVRLPLPDIAAWLAAEFRALPALPPGRIADGRRSA